MDVELTHPIYDIVGQVADEMGIDAYAVGGVVRDYFLQRPCSDIDIVCVGSGIALAKEVALRIDPHKEVHVFHNFGTAQFTYLYNNVEWEIEFVGARRESYQRDSRKPIVEDGTLQDDQNRRDFTINAMAVCLNSSRRGELVDPFGGIIDLDRGVIRTPLDPAVTFSDDPLRMLRAIRFASQLHFVILPECFQAIQNNAERIKIISMERISSELNKILLSERPSEGLLLLYKSKLLSYFFPELENLKGVETRGGLSHKDNFYHTLEVVDNVARKSDDLWLRWAALLHDIGKPATKRFDEKLGWTFHGHEVKGAKMVGRIFRRLRLPLDAKMKYVEKLVMLHLRPIVIADDVVTDSAVRRLLFEAGDDIDDLMLLCEADITSKQEAKKKRFRENYKLVRQKLVEIEEKDRIRNFQPPVSGLDIMQTFGLGPCHEVGVIKDAIKDAILDGTIPNNRDAAWQMMLTLANNMGLKQVDSKSDDSIIM
ncbi:MAG: HD domain-containing protein [Bacteroidales bacterium]|nr:HD domain-containing protein [Bacteroidales bacterium]